MSILVCIEKWGTPNNKNGGRGSLCPEYPYVSDL